MSAPTLPEQIRDSLSNRLVEWIVGSLLVGASVLIAAFGDAFFDLATDLLGKRWLLQLDALLVFSLVYSIAVAVRSRKKKTVFDRLRPVKGRGYSTDPVNGEAACPHCTTEERPVYLSDHGSALHCYVCNMSLLK